MHKLSVVSEANGKSSHLHLLSLGVCSWDLVPGTRLFCIHCVGRSVCTTLLKSTAATTKQGGLNNLKTWCLFAALMALEEVGTKWLHPA